MDRVPFRATMFHAVGLKAIAASEISSEGLEKSTQDRSEDIARFGEWEAVGLKSAGKMMQEDRHVTARGCLRGPSHGV